MRDKLIDLIQGAVGGCARHWAELIADHLLENGVTFAEDNNVGKWIPVSERLPEPLVSVLVQMPGEKPFPTVREGYIARDGLWYAGYFTREPGEVTHWMPLPEPPKEE